MGHQWALFRGFLRALDLGPDDLPRLKDDGDLPIGSVMHLLFDDAHRPCENILSRIAHAAFEACACVALVKISTAILNESDPLYPVSFNCRS